MASHTVIPPTTPQRRSPRLRNYDYTTAGAYFITICTAGRACLFSDGDMSPPTPNAAGEMIARWWAKLPENFVGVDLDVSVVMPNHLHGIVLLPDAFDSPPLSRIVQWFKTMTTNEYIRAVKTTDWPRFDGALWQRSFHDRIIRDERTLNDVREYIVNNPLQWELDEENPHGGG